MNILIVSYENLEFDGRLRQLVDSFSRMGNLYLFSTDKKKILSNHECFTGGGYLKYIAEAIKYGTSLKNIDVIVIDNRKPIIPARIIKNKLKIKTMILDCRETYFFEDVKHLTGKIGCLIEKPAILKADVVVAANLERAEIMKKRYKLKERPLVFENIRGLEYSANFDELAVQKKYEQILNTDEHIILASCGCNLDRITDVLVDNFSKVKHNCRLLLAGWSADADIQAIKQIIAKHNMNNVEILGRISQNELKYLTQHSDIGIVNYSQVDINNTYCASGKIFEFLFEGVPVVTTTNPPLARMCEEGQIGVADDRFAEGIDKVLDNLEFYKNNVVKYAEKKSVKNNNESLIQNIKKRLQL